MRSGKTWPNVSPPVPKNNFGRRFGRLRAAVRRATAILVACCAVATASAQITALPRPDSSTGDFFGTAVAIHEQRVLVGATGMDRCGTNSGAAYVYRRNEEVENWSLEAILEPDDCAPEMFFGRSVDLGDRFAVIAASREFFSRETPNAVYVFKRDSTSGTWEQIAKLTGGAALQEGSFATSVSLDGDRLLVTSSGDPSGRRTDGAAYIFDYDPSTRQWVRRHRLTGSGTLSRGVFGTSGALDGGVAAVTASTYFRNEPGSLFILEERSPASWSESHFRNVEDFFISVDAHDGRVLVGESKARRDDSGAATLFEKRKDGSWDVAQVLRPDHPYPGGAFGSAVALDGDYALVVGFDEQLGLNINIDRVVFVFRYYADTGKWRQLHVLDVGEVSFGTAVDVHKRYAVVGSASDHAPGAAFVARLPD